MGRLNPFPDSESDLPVLAEVWALARALFWTLRPAVAGGASSVPSPWYQVRASGISSSLCQTGQAGLRHQDAGS